MHQIVKSFVFTIERCAQIRIMCKGVNNESIIQEGPTECTLLTFFKHLA